MKYLIKNRQKDRQTFGGEKREKPIKKDRGRKRFLRRSRKTAHLFLTVNPKTG